MDRPGGRPSNAQVRWEGTYTGLTPVLVGETVEPPYERREQIMQDLISALSDEDSFVAAHVLLTRLSGVGYEAFPTWNGLNVDIAADGTVTIDPDQRFDLARRWERWYNSEPRPETLPPSE